MLKRIVPFLTLFSSLSTLVCCALPALLVTLGMGAAFASFLGSFPQLIWLSEHKILVFTFAGVMLLCSGLLRWFGSEQSCPVDPELARACTRTRKISGGIFYGSVAIYAVGAFFAFLAPIFL